MLKQEKVDCIRLRLTPDLKSRFQAACKERSINGSELIRKLMETWLKGEPVSVAASLRNEASKTTAGESDRWKEKYLELELQVLKERQEMKKLIAQMNEVLK